MCSIAAKLTISIYFNGIIFRDFRQGYGILVLNINRCVYNSGINAYHSC